MKRNLIIDPRIQVGMVATMWQDENKKNVFIYKIISTGKRIRVFSPETKETLEFSLRKNGKWVKTDEKTNNYKTFLAFPVLIRKDLKRIFPHFY